MDKQKIRDEIDRLDSEMLMLLNRRFELAVQVRRLKLETLVADREAEVVANVRRGARNLLRPEFVQNLYQRIIEESRYQQDRQLPLIGFQGSHGAYSEVAAASFCPEGVTLSCERFDSVVEGVRAGILDFGALPVENSVAGSVDPVLDLLVTTELHIVGEVLLPVHHCLLTLPETDYQNVRQVFSHFQALAQCKNFLDRNRLDACPYSDTAGAARMIARDRIPGAAAIASKECAEIYGLSIIKENIEDDSRNTTRFFVVAREPLQTDGDKCSVVFSLGHTPGSLSEALGILSEGGMNLTRIESRPILGSAGQFAFLVDFEGSARDVRVASSLEKLQSKVSRYRLLGCYPRALSVPKV